MEAGSRVLVLAGGAEGGAPEPSSGWPEPELEVSSFSDEEWSSPGWFDPWSEGERTRKRGRCEGWRREEEGERGGCEPVREET